MHNILSIFGRKKAGNFLIQYCAFAECSTGARTLRANVDFELYCLCRIPVSHDSMESLYPRFTPPQIMYGGFDRVVE